MTTTPAAAAPVLRTAYQKSVADYWNNEKDPVNLRLGDVDGLYHHHYGLGDYDPSVLEGPEETRDERIIAELHRLESAQADVLLDHLGPIAPDHRLLDAALRPRRHQHHGQRPLRLPGGRCLPLRDPGRVRQRPGP